MNLQDLGRVGGAGSLVSSFLSSQVWSSVRVSGCSVGQKDSLDCTLLVEW